MIKPVFNYQYNNPEVPNSVYLNVGNELADFVVALGDYGLTVAVATWLCCDIDGNNKNFLKLSC